MKFPTKHSLGAVVLMLLISAGIAVEASAQTALPVFVNFRFKDSVRNPLIVASEPKISELLAKSMSEDYRYWDFRAGKPTDFPRLDVWLEKASGWDMKMEFYLSAGATRKPDKAWQCVLFETGETDRRFNGGLPPGERFAEEINKAFKSRMLGSQREAISTILKKYAPLGNVLMRTEPTRAVLALNWDNYRALGKSRFKIVTSKGTGANAVSVTLLSEATGHPEPYPGSAPPWKAIAVKHLKFDNDAITAHLGELRQLQLQTFFLDNVVDVLSFGDDDVAPIPEN